MPRGPAMSGALRGVAGCFCCDPESITAFKVPPQCGDFPWLWQIISLARGEILCCFPPLLAAIAFDMPCGIKSVRTFLSPPKAGSDHPTCEPCQFTTKTGFCQSWPFAILKGSGLDFFEEKAYRWRLCPVVKLRLRAVMLHH